MALSSISIGPGLYRLILYFNHSIGLASLISQVGSYVSNCNHFDQFVLFSIRAQKHSWTIQSECVCGFEMVQAPPIGVCVCVCVSPVCCSSRLPPCPWEGPLKSPPPPPRPSAICCSRGTSTEVSHDKDCRSPGRSSSRSWEGSVVRSLRRSDTSNTTTQIHSLDYNCSLYPDLGSNSSWKHCCDGTNTTSPKSANS